MNVIKGNAGAEAVYALELGVSSFNAGKWEDAIKHSQEALDKGMEVSRAYYVIGAAYYELGNYPKAIEHLTKATMINPNEASYHLDLGTAYFYSEKYGAAANAFRAELKCKPNDPKGLFGLGASCNNAAEAFMDKKNYKKAIEFYIEAESALTKFLSSGAGTEKEIAIAEETLESIRTRIMDAKTKSKQ